MIPFLILNRRFMLCMAEDFINMCVLMPINCHKVTCYIYPDIEWSDETIQYGVPSVKLFRGHKWILYVICRYSFILHLKMFALCPNPSTIWAIVYVICLLSLCCEQIYVWHAVFDMLYVQFYMQHVLIHLWYIDFVMQHVWNHLCCV